MLHTAQEKWHWRHQKSFLPRKIIYHAKRTSTITCLFLQIYLGLFNHFICYIKINVWYIHCAYWIVIQLIKIGYAISFTIAYQISSQIMLMKYWIFFVVYQTIANKWIKCLSYSKKIFSCIFTECYLVTNADACIKLYGNHLKRYSTLHANTLCYFTLPQSI